MSQQSYARTFSETEVQILEAFLRCCSRTGVESVTLAEISKEAELAFGTVHYYFGGKKRRDLPLSAAVHVARKAQEFTSRLVDQASHQEHYDPIASYIRSTFAWARSHEVHASYWIHHLYLTSIRSKLREINGTVISKSRKKVEGLLFESTGRGRATTSKNPALQASQIHSLLMGCLTLGLTDPTPGALDREERSALSGVNAMMSEAGRAL
ncbi:MAG: hypothetical protein A2X94_08245 [Bdellovibrionales bacterium GWB1_55_8]|nr:MAG: hypothetical protein A2X94_08245 [Bdellovibrionales bacterium GWB1_55_8]